MSETHNNKRCWECDREDLPIHNHHPIPRVRGGKRTIPLCESCHSKAHHKNKRMMTSQLTKEGLVRAKARGVKLGGPEYMKANRCSQKVRGAQADDFAQKLAPTIASLVNSGTVRNSHIAKHLNQIGVKTRWGKAWSCQTVKNLRTRIEAMNLIP